MAIIWTYAGIVLIRPSGTNFSEILIEIDVFSFNKMHLKMSSAKCRPFFLGLNVLIYLLTRCYTVFTYVLRIHIPRASTVPDVCVCVFWLELIGSWDICDLNTDVVISSISCEIAIRWMSHDFTDHYSTLFQAMTCCHQATSHYLSQCWPRSMSPYGVQLTVILLVD